MLESATPLFLIGCPRSGTTFLTKILNAHANILLTNESAAFLLMDHIANKCGIGISAGLMYGKSHNTTLASFIDNQYRGFLTGFYEEVARDEGKPAVKFWGEKHPHLSLCIERVNRHFPEARYIYMVRDPRDSALSIAAMTQSNFFSALRGWMGTSAIYERFTGGVPESRIYKVRYEDLVADCEGGTDAVLRWLGLPMTPEVHGFIETRRNVDAHADGSSRDFSAESVGRWTRQLTSEQNKAAVDMTANFLDRHGYRQEPIFPEARTHIARQKDSLEFTCNVCGLRNNVDVTYLSRERKTCEGCGSSVRMRSIVHLLSVELFGRSLALPDFPERKDIRGVGLSDWAPYAAKLSERLRYENTYFHQEPRLDITSIDDSRTSTCDFVISSDVFEHVLPPVSRAFDGARRLLKETGFLVLTVPFTLKGDETVEHFPELYNFEIKEAGNQRHLHNQRRDGAEEIFENLKFHGGAGATLEFRVFCKSALVRDLGNAGFSDITIFDDPVPQWGILWQKPWSTPILARP